MSGVELDLGSGRPLAAEGQRLALALADDAIGRLYEAVSSPSEDAVHEARKRFKELRALLRLIESAAGRRRTKRARMLLRDAGRALSGARDADALGETFEKLRERFGDAFVRSAAFTDVLIARAREATLDADGAFAIVAGVRNEIVNWAFDASPGNIAAGLHRSIRAGRRAMERALRERGPAEFHEWRKREKDAWYHARMAHTIVTGMEELEPTLRRLARVLGDHHDLVILRELATKSADRANAPDAINVLALARLRMNELEEEAEVLGAKAFGKTSRGLKT